MKITVLTTNISMAMFATSWFQRIILSPYLCFLKTYLYNCKCLLLAVCLKWLLAWNLLRLAIHNFVVSWTVSLWGNIYSRPNPRKPKERQHSVKSPLVNYLF